MAAETAIAARPNSICTDSCIRRVRAKEPSDAVISMIHYQRKKAFAIIVAYAAFSLAPFAGHAEGHERPDNASRTLRQPIAAEGDLPGTLFEGLSVDLSSRGEVIDFFKDVYQKTLDESSHGTGYDASCDAAMANQGQSNAILTMINYFRAMSGLPGNVDLDADLAVTAKRSEVLRTGHRHPTTTPGCPKVASLEHAYSSLAQGNGGAAGVVAHMRDEDDVDTSAARRRWILYPPLQLIGTAPTDSDSDFYSSAKHLWDIPNRGNRPATPEWVAWPPKGIVPYHVVYRRWSLSRNSLHGADFSGATVSMKADGKSVDLERLPVVTGIGDNTLVWEPSMLALGPGQRDKTITVEVENIVVNGVPRRLAYKVTVIDPEQSVVGNSGLGLYDPDDAAFTLTSIEPRRPGVSNPYSSPGPYTPDTLFLIPGSVKPNGPGASNPDPGPNLYDPDEPWFILSTGAAPIASDKTFTFGPRLSDMLPVVGDWTDTGQDSVALYDQRQGTFTMRLEEGNTSNFRFGKRDASWLPVAGDWDGRHGDTVGLYDPARSRFFLSNDYRAQNKFAGFRYGRANAGWIPIAGDWDGDGSDSVGLYDPKRGRFLLKNRNRPGSADLKFRFGPKNSRLIPVAGDWDGDGIDTVGLYKPSLGKFLLKNRNERGRANLRRRLPHHGPRSIPIAGRWNGSRRTQPPHKNFGVVQGTVEIVNTCGNVSISMETECAPQPASIPLELQALGVAGPL